MTSLGHPLSLLLHGLRLLSVAEFKIQHPRIQTPETPGDWKIDLDQSWALATHTTRGSNSCACH